MVLPAMMKSEWLHLHSFGLVAQQMQLLPPNCRPPNGHPTGPALEPRMLLQGQDQVLRLDRAVRFSVAKQGTPIEVRMSWAHAGLELMS